MQRTNIVQNSAIHTLWPARSPLRFTGLKLIKAEWYRTCMSRIVYWTARRTKRL